MHTCINASENRLVGQSRRDHGPLLRVVLVLEVGPGRVQIVGDVLLPVIAEVFFDQLLGGLCPFPIVVVLGRAALLQLDENVGVAIFNLEKSRFD